MSHIRGICCVCHLSLVQGDCPPRHSLTTAGVGDAVSLNQEQHRQQNPWMWFIHEHHLKTPYEPPSMLAILMVELIAEQGKLITEARVALLQ